MSTTIACIKGHMGNTTYYEAKMPVRELVSSVRPAKELDKWASMGIAERIQREPQMKRIEKEIAPYYAETEDRFFNSLVILIYEAEVHYDTLKDIVKNVPHAYKQAANNMGFLTIEGGALVVLDGQHRLLALEKVFKQEITGKYSADVQNDEISVIFINHEDNKKTRRIFNKINRYAKSTSRGDNIITSEDDVSAIIARDLLDDEAPLGITVKDEKGNVDVIVNWKSNTLSARSTKFTTISVLYDVSDLILKHHKKISGNKTEKQTKPSDEEVHECYEIVAQYWTEVLNNLDAYKLAMANPSSIPEYRAPEAEYSLLFKPAAQLSLFNAILKAEDRGLSLKEITSRLNKVDWSMKSGMWKDIIIRSNGTIDPKAQARDNAAELIAYLISADKMNEDLISKVQEMFNTFRGGDEELPTPVEDCLIKK